MQTKLLQEGEESTWALVFATGDQVMEPLAAFAQEQELAASEFAAIGAFEEATLGYFNLERRAYDQIPVHEQVELLSLIGLEHDVRPADGRSGCRR